VKHTNKSIGLEFVKKSSIFTLLAFTFSCSSSPSSNEVNPVNQTPVLEDTSPATDSDDLLAQFGTLQTRLIADTRDSLLRLNAVVSEGTLEPEFSDCVAENGFGPVLEYYCGESGNFGTPSSLPNPVISFSFVNDLACVSAMTDQNDASACELSFVQIPSNEKFVTYSFLEVDTIPVTTIEISNELVPNFIDVEFLTNYCKIRVIGQAEITSNDEDYCSTVIGDVLADFP